MYRFIYDPVSLDNVSINSKKGKSILKNYLNELKGGHKNPCALNNRTNRCKKSNVGDGNCTNHNGRCKKIKNIVAPQQVQLPAPSPPVQQNHNCAINNVTNRCKKSIVGDNNCKMGNKNRCVKIKKNKRPRPIVVNPNPVPQRPPTPTPTPTPNPIIQLVPEPFSRPIHIIQSPEQLSLTQSEIDKLISFRFIKNQMNGHENALNIIWEDRATIKQIVKKILKKNGINFSKCLLGEGLYGKVYHTKDNLYIIKISKNRWDYRDTSVYPLYEIIYEMVYHNILAEKNIGPKLHPVTPFFITRRGRQYAIVLKKYTSDLKDYFKKLRREINVDKKNKLIQKLDNEIVTKIDSMIELGIVCFDLKPGNMLLDYDEDLNIYEFVLSDFGSDFCCNLKIHKICDFYKIGIQNLFPKYLEYIKYLLYVLIAFMSFDYYGVKILSKEMNILNQLLKNQIFVHFCNHISQNEDDFHVIKHYLKIGVSDRTKHGDILFLITHFLTLYFE